MSRKQRTDVAVVAGAEDDEVERVGFQIGLEAGFVRRSGGVYV